MISLMVGSWVLANVGLLLGRKPLQQSVKWAHGMCIRGDFIPVHLNLVCTSEELHTIRTTNDRAAFNAAKSSASARKVADEHCSKCGLPCTSTRYTVVNYTMLLTEAELNNLTETATPEEARVLISIGRRRADMVSCVRQVKHRMRSCSQCGAAAIPAENAE